MKFSNVSISKKLIMSFGINLILIVFLSVYAILSLENIQAISEKLVREPLPKSVIASHMVLYARQLRTREFQHLLEDDNGKRKFETQMGTSLSDLDAAIQEYSVKFKSDVDKKNIEDFKSAWYAYMQFHPGAIEMSNKGQIKQAVAVLNGEAKKVFDGPVQTSLLAISKQSETSGINMASHAQTSAQKAILTLIVISIVSIVLSSWLACLIGCGITNPLKLATRSAKLLTEGDTNIELNYVSKDEVGLLCSALVEVAQHQQYMADVASSIEHGNLTCHITPKSEHDLLGHSFASMITGLRSIISQIVSSALTMSNTASKLGEIGAKVESGAVGIAGITQEISSACEQTTQSSINVAHSSEEQSASYQKEWGIFWSSGILSNQYRST